MACTGVAAALPPTAEIASTPDDPLVLGVQGIDDAANCQLSRDGRIVLFTSAAWNLLPGDHNRVTDVFVRDRVGGGLTRLLGPGGSELSEPPGSPRLSGDGRWIAFHTEQALVAGDTNGDYDVYLWSRNDGSIELISRNAAGAALGGTHPDPSFDGRHVAFISDAPAWVGTSGNQALRLDRNTGTVEAISIGSAGVFGNAPAYEPRVIGSRWVAFGSGATDLVAGDTNGQGDVFVRDLQLGTTRRVSLSATGAQLPSSSSLVDAVAGSTPMVLFSSAAVVVAGDTNGIIDLFRVRLDNGAIVHMSPSVNGGFRAAGTLSTSAASQDGARALWGGADGGWDPTDTNGHVDLFIASVGSPARRLSDGAAGVNADGASSNPCADAAATTIGFSTRATNLAVDDHNRAQDVVLCEGQPCVFERVSDANSPQPVAVDRQRSQAPDLSADGRFVAFAAEGSLLAAGTPDDLPYRDIVVRDRALLRTFLLTPGDATGDTPAISDDGRYVAFLSQWMPPLYTASSPLQTQAFLHDRNTGTTRLISAASSGAPADARVTAVAIAGNGCCVVFATAASNLTAGDANARSDLFVFDVATGTLARISPAGGLGGGDAPKISRDGRRIVFESYDSNYVAGDSNGSTDVFVHDRNSLAYFRASLAGSQEPDNDSFEPDLSDDGRVVVFTSRAQNLQSPPLTESDDRLYRLAIGESMPQAVGRRPDGTALRAGDAVYAARLSADGSVLTYFGDFEDLLLPGATTTTDVAGLVLRDEGTQTEVFSATPSGSWVYDSSDRQAIALDGSGNRLALATDSGDFAPLLDHNTEKDVLVLVRQVPVDALFASSFE